MIFFCYRAICDFIFEKYSDKERIYKFSAPKILKLIEILRQFKPKRLINQANNNIINNLNDKEKIEPTNNLIFLNRNNNINNNDNKINDSVMIECSIDDDNNDDDLKNIKKDLILNSNNDATLISNNDDNNLLVKTNGVNNNCCNNLNSNQNKNNLEINKFNNSLESDDIIGMNNCINKSKKELNNLSNTSCKVAIHDHINFINSERSYNKVIENGIKSTHDDQLPEDSLNLPLEFSSNRSGIGGGGGRWRGKGRGWRYQRRNQQTPYNNYRNKFTSLDDADNLCCIIFVEKRFTAKVLSHFLNVSFF